MLQPGVGGDAALVAALQDHVRQTLAPYETPKAIEFVDALPMTTTGRCSDASCGSAKRKRGGGK